MTPLFSKLNLGDQTEIVVLNAPESFEKELTALRGVAARRTIRVLKDISFALAFMTRQNEVSEIARSVAPKRQSQSGFRKIKGRVIIL
jgi:hypothetical protein